FFSAFFSAAERALGATPSWFAASVTIAALRALGEVRVEAAIAPPLPAIARAATAPAMVFCLRLSFISGLLGGWPGPEGDPDGVRLAVPLERDADLVARLVGADHPGQVFRRRDR